MRKQIINENWDTEEVLDLEDLCAVLFKRGTNDAGYVEAFDFDDLRMRDAYNNLVNQYQEANADDTIHIYLVKLPNTNQVLSLLNSALYNGNERVPEAIEAVNDLCNRADCETLGSWSGCLQEGKKKKKVCSSSYCGFTDPELNIKHFNHCMGTGGLQNPNSKHLVVGDVLPNAPVAAEASSAGASDAGDSGNSGNSSGSNGGGMGESLTETPSNDTTVTDAIDEFIGNFDDTAKAPQEKSATNEVEADLDKYIATLENLDEDVEKEIKIQNNENIEEDEEELDPPIDLEYFPNNMGINLSNVKSEKWTEQDDGQLKSVTVEFDPAKNPDVEPTDESLNEATLKYSVQLEKMRQLEAGTRGFNSANASLEKILYNYDICIDHNLPRARKAMEDALRQHGWDSYIKPTKKPAKLYDFGYLTTDVSFYNQLSVHEAWANRSNTKQFINGPQGGNVEDLLVVLIIYKVVANSTAYAEIKQHLCANYTIDAAELEQFTDMAKNNTEITDKIHTIWAEESQRSKNLNSVSSTGAVILRPDEFTAGFCSLVYKYESGESVCNYCMAVTGTTRHLLLALIYAISFKKDAAFIEKIKEVLTVNCGYDTDKIKETIQNCLSDTEKMTRINELVAKVLETAAAKKESLTEAHRDDPEVVELTNEIKDDVEQLKDLGINKVELDEAAKRYVKRYYVRPQNIFCSNKEDILKALLRVDGENCSIYSLKNLSDHDDVQELQPSDIIYYYDDGILYDKNHVKVMDYDLNVKHEEERKKFADVDSAPDSQVNDEYDDRLTDADLQDKEAVANFRAINARQLK